MSSRDSSANRAGGASAGPGVRLRLFATAREAAGRASDTFSAAACPTVAAVLQAANSRYGPEFAGIVETARIWLNGDEPPQGFESPLGDGDEVAILPPVSGG